MDAGNPVVENDPKNYGAQVRVFMAMYRIVYEMCSSLHQCFSEKSTSLGKLLDCIRCNLPFENSQKWLLFLPEYTVQHTGLCFPGGEVVIQKLINSA